MILTIIFNTDTIRVIIFVQRPLRNVQANPSASPITPEKGQSAPTRGVGQESPCFGQGCLNWSLLFQFSFSF
ncbi:hypothetical protein MK280_00875, partial [Myxococcota bacterium]|nr:hypothetical protein [Myxococcota bacterium]